MRTTFRAPHTASQRETGHNVPRLACGWKAAAQIHPLGKWKACEPNFAQKRCVLFLGEIHVEIHLRVPFCGILGRPYFFVTQFCGPSIFGQEFGLVIEGDECE